MRSTTTAVTALLAVAGFMASPSFACQCGHQQDVVEAFASAAVVFEGQAIAMAPVLGRIPETSTTIPLHGWRFRVLRVWKGTLGQEVEVTDDAGNCSFVFQHGASYLVFATPHRTLPGHCATTICTATRALAATGAPIPGLGQPVVVQKPEAVGPETLVQSAYRVLLASWYTGWCLGQAELRRAADSESATLVVIQYSAYLALAALALLVLGACVRGHAARVAAIAAVVALLAAAAALLGGYEYAAHNVYLEDFVRLKR